MHSAHIDKIWRAKTPESRDEFFTDAMLNLDVSAYAFGVDFVKRNPEKLLCSYRPDWQEHYMTSGLYEHDPTIDVGLQTDRALTWNEIAARGYTENVFRAASDFGIGNGTTIPIYVGGSRSIISITQKLTPPQEEDILHLCRAYIRASTPHQKTGYLPRLSTADYLFFRQVCRAKEKGLSNTQIATDHKIALVTVNQRLKKIYNVLGVNNLSGAIYVAHRDRLI